VALFAVVARGCAAVGDLRYPALTPVGLVLSISLFVYIRLGHLLHARRHPCTGCGSALGGVLMFTLT